MADGPISLSRPIEIGASRQMTQESQKQKLKEASELYEQHFLREMVKAMRQTVGKGEFIKTNQAEKIYQEQLDSEYVKQWGQSGGVGLADMIFEQLSEKLFPKDNGLGIPQGPLPMKDSKIHPLSDSKEGGRVKLIEQKQISPNEMGFLFQSEGQPGGESVQSPWAGEVAQAYKDPLVGRHTFRIKHEQGSESMLSFVGPVEPGISEGSRLEAGQRLGAVSPVEPFVAWKVTKSGST